MRKKSKPRKSGTRKNESANAAIAEKNIDQGRRNLLRKARNGALGVGVVGGLSFLLVQHVQSTIREHDLSLVDNGKPTVVQIHDPQCSLCIALQKETRQALKHFDGGDLDYVVANIRSPEGRGFANRYGVQHVTLLLFDGKGKLQEVLQGQRSSVTLRAAFQRLL